MTKQQWWKESVVYQIYPRSFYDSNGDGIGDIQGIIEKLDYIKELGANVIWLSPVYESPNDDNGYDISDYRKIMNEFGTMKDWELLLKSVHDRGMKLIMDLVVNHTSDEHNWFIESKASKESSYRDYYIWRPGKEGKEPNNWASFFGGSTWTHDEGSGDYYLHLFSKKQPDLNWENPDLRNAIYDMMTWWLDKGIDGFRMDVINLISKSEGLPSTKNKERYDWGGEYFMNGPLVHEYIQEMNQKVLSQYDIMTVGECPGASIEDAIRYANNEGTELKMIFTFEHMDLDSGPEGKWDVKPWNLLDLKKVMTKWQVELEGKAWNSLYLNNHDQPRMVSRFGDDSTYRVESAKMLATFLHMMKGTPYIYQGEEIGMTNVRFESINNYQDLETLNFYNEMLANNMDAKSIMNAIYIKGRDNARTPMQWDDTMNGGFTSGTPWLQLNPNYREINVKTVLEDKGSIYYYYQKLIELRNGYDIIVHGKYELLLENNLQLFVYTRTLEDRKLLVLCNFSAESAVFTMPHTIHYDTSRLLIGNYDADSQENIQTMLLNAYEARVYLLN